MHRRNRFGVRVRSGKFGVWRRVGRRVVPSAAAAGWWSARRRRAELVAAAHLEEVADALADVEVDLVDRLRRPGPAPSSGVDVTMLASAVPTLAAVDADLSWALLSVTRSADVFNATLGDDPRAVEGRLVVLLSSVRTARNIVGSVR